MRWRGRVVDDRCSLPEAAHLGSRARRAASAAPANRVQGRTPAWLERSRVDARPGELPRDRVMVEARARGPVLTTGWRAAPANDVRGRPTPDSRASRSRWISVA